MEGYLSAWSGVTTCWWTAGRLHLQMNHPCFHDCRLGSLCNPLDLDHGVNL